jgi:hypothetical protein
MRTLQTEMRGIDNNEIMLDLECFSIICKTKKDVVVNEKSIKW